MLIRLKDEEGEEGLIEGLVMGGFRDVLYSAIVLFLVSKIECRAIFRTLSLCYAESR